MIAWVHHFRNNFKILLDYLSIRVSTINFNLLWYEHRLRKSTAMTANCQKLWMSINTLRWRLFFQLAPDLYYYKDLVKVWSLRWCWENIQTSDLLRLERKYLQTPYAPLKTYSLINFLSLDEDLNLIISLRVILKAEQVHNVIFSVLKSLF